MGTHAHGDVGSLCCERGLDKQMWPVWFAARIPPDVLGREPAGQAPRSRERTRPTPMASLAAFRDLSGHGPYLRRWGRGPPGLMASLFSGCQAGLEGHPGPWRPKG